MSNQKKAGRGYAPRHRKEPSPGAGPARPGGLATRVLVTSVVSAATLAIPATAALAASAPPGAPAAGAAGSVTGIPTTLASPPLVGPSAPSRTGGPTFSGFGGVSLPFSADGGFTGFHPFGGLFITPPNLRDMPVGSIPLMLGPVGPGPAAAAASPPGALDPAPSFDPLAHDPLIQGLINSGIGGGLPDAQLSDALAQFQPQLPSLGVPGGSGALTAGTPTASPVPFVSETSQFEQLLGQSVNPGFDPAPFEQLIQNYYWHGGAFPPRSEIMPSPDMPSPDMPGPGTADTSTADTSTAAVAVAVAGAGGGDGAGGGAAPVVTEAVPDDPAAVPAPVVADATPPIAPEPPAVTSVPPDDPAASPAPVVADAAPAAAPAAPDDAVQESMVAFAPPTGGGGAYYG